MKLALGAEPLLSGFQFSSGQELLIAIRDYAVSVGQSAIADNISSTGELVLRGTTSNGHNCWIRLRCVIEPERQYLEIRGDLDGTGAFLSPPLELNFDLGYTNRAWMMGDNDSFGICVRNRFTYSGGIGCGFLERFDESDEFAWVIAYANNRLNDAYVAKSHLGTTWARIGDSYFNADQFSSIALNGAYQGILDYLIALPFASLTARTIANAGFFAHEGSRNGTNNQGLITRRFYVEGNEDPENYTNETTFKCRGFIKHFYNGFGSFLGGATYPGSNGNSYISVGSEGWQALRIVDSENPLILPEEELSVVYQNAQILSSDRTLSEIRSPLTELGWLVTSDTLDTAGNRTLILQGQYFDRPEYCYLNLKSFADSGLVEIRAELREDPQSPGILSPVFNFSNIANLRLSANAQAGAMTITSNGTKTSLYFGFYGGRIDPEDKYAWGFGKVGTDLSQMFLAKSRLTGESWKPLSEQFNTSVDSRSSFPANGVGDRLGTPLFPLDFFNNPDPRNSARKLSADSGNLDFLAIVEGRANPLDYGSVDSSSDRGFQLYGRGYIQFCCVGGSGSASTEAEFVDGVRVA